MPPPIDRIPIVLLTGFLGSGKTTLLRALLQCPQARGTAVLINELGAIGLDHHLAWGAADSTLVLENGCVCCSVQHDLSSALEDLFWKRLHRKIPRFERVVIETTGIADPGRIVEMFSSQSLVAQRYVLSSVVCTVDGMFGERQLGQHPECLAQAAGADAIHITKTDIAEEGGMASLERLLQRVNPAAVCRRSVAGVAATGVLFDAFAGPSSGKDARAKPASLPLSIGGAQASGGVPGPLSLAGIHQHVSSFVLRFKRFEDHDEVDAMLRDVLSKYGARILRIKGLVEVGGDALPRVVQAVGACLYPAEQLPAGAPWGGPGFLIFIVLGVSREELLRDGLVPVNRLVQPGQEIFHS